MKTLKICFFLFGLFFIANGKAQAQAQTMSAAQVGITSLLEEVPLNADNSISIPITIEIIAGSSPLTLRVKVSRVGGSRVAVSGEISDVPTAILQTTLTVPNASVGEEYLVRCGSVEHGLNDGGCTIIVVP